LRQGDWFAHYANHFNTVEINYSFYRLPTEHAFDRWRGQAPPGFVYALKANRFLTHVKRLKDCEAALDQFVERARRLEETLGPILWQLPPNWRPDVARLEAFVRRLPQDLIHAFEFRDERWLVDEVREMLETRGLATCIYDMPGTSCPMWVTAPAVYLRFHGVGVAYGGRYGEEHLLPWAVKIRTWLDEGRRVFAYFNNDAFGFALEDAMILARLVEDPEAPAGTVCRT
jgi:uncharacterized protein YecE (DUF72 family)